MTKGAVHQALSVLEGAGVRRTEVAKEVGIHRSHLYRIEHGLREPTAPVISSLLSFLNRPENLRKLGRRKPLSFEEVFGAKAA